MPVTHGVAGSSPVRTAEKQVKVEKEVKASFFYARKFPFHAAGYLFSDQCQKLWGEYLIFTSKHKVE